MIFKAMSTGLHSKRTMAPLPFGTSSDVPPRPSTPALAGTNSNADTHPVIAQFYNDTAIQEQVQQVARKFARQPADQDDIMQLFWLKVAQNPGKFDIPDQETCRKMVWVTATNVARDWLRRQKRQRTVLYEDIVKADHKGQSGKSNRFDTATDGRYRGTQSPEENLLKQEQVEIGHAVLAKLDDVAREVLMRFADGEPLQQIAMAMGLKYGQVRTLAHRAREKLQTLLPPVYRKTG